METVSVPFVNVPVLSNTIVFILCAFSKLSLDFKSIPFLLQIPEAITIANGVANPKLQGHATTKIVTNIFIAKVKFCVITNQTIQLMIAILIILF